MRSLSLVVLATGAVTPAAAATDLTGLDVETVCPAGDNSVDCSFFNCLRGGNSVADCFFLSRFYYEMGGDDWTNNTNWGTATNVW